MSKQVKTPLEIGKVSLKVNGLARMLDYYENEFGLDVLTKDEQTATLGIEAVNKTLLELTVLDKPSRKSKAAGLFHMAFLLPKRKDLGDVLLRFDAQNTRITNEYDHGLTEAIYLYDPELNGIEIYRDKQVEELDGITEITDGEAAIPMDSKGVRALGDMVNIPAKFPAGTLMGHVHLAVSELEGTYDFYHNLLGLVLMSKVEGKVVFLSDGEYHHHLAGNTWTSRNASKPEASDRGLEYFEMLFDDINAIVEKLDQVNYSYSQLDNGGLELEDPNGITLHILKR